ncbi:sugar transporter [Cloacibacterium rupense]|uniref:Sugar transporter n=2 Tax=Cloacibacterium rupense TaxID=517423 RepID=A0ABQ2NHE8_9FLAO|nr:sugar transporter [Cloacibacterium rupense]
MSFGFMGVQIGYSLQNANTSRILSAIGADPHNLSLFWLAAPLAGLFVQPIVGLSSDKTWTRLGRRIPFILGGAIVSALAMFFMPNSEHFAQLLPAVFFGAMMLLFMDVSFNVTMQPFRALVSDMVDESQRNKGYAIQSFLINVGAVVGSLLPFLLTNVFHVANEPGAGQKVAPTVIWAFYFGGGVLLLSVLWTALRTKEYPPEEYAKYNNLEDQVEEKVSFMDLLKNIPLTMKQLAITQFFSWFALFLMWVYTTQGIAEHVWGASDAHSKEFNEAGNWTGVIFAAYSVFAALFSLAITPLANKFGRKNVYMISLILGGLGLISMLFIQDKNLLLIPMVGVGISWAAILALPYAILSSSLPPKQTGVYMGLFNATITIPQIAAGLLGGVILSAVDGKAINMLVIAGVSMAIAGVCAKLFITAKEND